MSEQEKYYHQIIKKLNHFTKKEFVIKAIEGSLIFLTTLFASFFLIVLMESVFNFSSGVRTVLFFLFLVLNIYILGKYVIVPLLISSNIMRSRDHYTTASIVGGYFPTIKDELLNSMQLLSAESKTNRYSPALINAAFKNIYERSRKVEFESVLSFERVKRLGLISGITIVIVSLMIFFISPFSSAANRVINFDDEFIPPAKFKLIVEPGNTEASKGDDVFISVNVEGEKPDDIYLAIRNEEEAEFNFEKLSPDSTGSFEFVQKNIRSSLNYYAFADDISSDQFKIEVLDKPVLKNFSLNVIPPSYSGLNAQTQKNNGNVTGLVGSKINLKLESTKKLDSAFILLNDSTKISLNSEDQSATGNFRIKSKDNYKIILVDKDGNENDDPINYTIEPLFDLYPKIEMINPDKDVSLGNDNRVPLLTKISDDYGFRKLVLNFKLSSVDEAQSEEEFRSIEIPFDKSLKETSIDYIWNLSRFSLGAKDEISYYLEIFDNDVISGPKSSKTKIYKIRIPSLSEILSGINKTHEKAEQDLEETLKEADKLKKELERIDQKLKQNDEELTWEEKDKVEKAIEKFEEMQEKLEEVQKDLGKMQQQMQENNLLSKETMEKYMELQELMDELTSDELKKAMEQMRNKLQQMNKDQMQNAMENFKMDEENFKKSIERTMNLLKRIQIEQKLDELTKRSEMLSEKQENLNEQTKQSDLSKQNEQEELSSKQDEVTEELENLEKEMEELSEKMSELDDMPKEKFDEMMEKIKEQQNQEKSEETSEQLQKGMKKKAEQNQTSLCENMQKMSMMMEQMKEAVQQESQLETFNEMMKILDNLVSLSKDQEKLKNQSSQNNQGENSFNESMKEQNSLMSDLNKIMKQISELSQKSFSITPEMGKTLGDAMKQMEQSLQSLKNKNGSFAGISQSEAMKHLNEAATMMKSSMEGMMQGGSGGGMMSLMQQLQQLSGQQMQLNNLTQMLQQMQQGELSEQQQGQLQRLAQEQQVIQKSMEQLNREAKESGETSKIPADLERVVQEMKEVITDMNTERLDDQLIQKQERILSKLLDAQRSINERDFEKQRESYTGENILRDSPGEISLDSKQQKIREELNKALREGYSRDYEELIKKYYEALQKGEIKN